MHYIRLLRPPKLLRSRHKSLTELLFTITTDLGDSFLFPETFLALTVEAHLSSHQSRPDDTDAGERRWLLSQKGELSWQPGMRVLKIKLGIPKTMENLILDQHEVDICIKTSDPQSSADDVYKIIQGEQELVMPVWVPLGQSNTNTNVCFRKPFAWPLVEVEEEIGESIARHIWDAGLVALCAIAGPFTVPELSSTQHSCIKAMANMLCREEPLSILELGCGVGILGVGTAAIYSLATRDHDIRGPRSILMTDLEEAEGRARANIHRQAKRSAGKPNVTQDEAQVMYENLDWEDGRQGRFGPQLQSRRWDLVMLSDCTYNVDMLPALIETLSAVHTANLTHGAPAGEPSPTKVFLATKPRHASERALFDLLASHGWSTAEKQILPLPVMGSEAESVEMYLFEKL